MHLVEGLYDHFIEKARHTRIACITIGLSYTAVLTDEGGMGLAFTYPRNNSCCSVNRGYRDHEGEPAGELLADIKGADPFRRSVALALVNALNFGRASNCPEDPTDSVWMDAFGVGRGTRVAMVGFFRPLMHVFEDRGAVVEALDESHGMGDRDGFYEKLGGGWAEVLLVTSTSILNDSTEEVLARLAPGAKVVMLGPSTPMVAEVFQHLPVRMLAGTVPVDQERVLKAVRHGVGTPVIHKFSRKVYMELT